MRKIVSKDNLGWEAVEVLTKILNVARLPELIIIETVEDED